MTLEELEREHMRRVLNEVKGDKVKAAQVLGIHLSTLYRKVQRYRLENGGRASRRRWQSRRCRRLMAEQRILSESARPRIIARP